MQVRTQTQRQVTVELTEAEAKWLRDLVQNRNSVHEPPEHGGFRRNLFDQLSHGLGLDVERG